MKNKVVGLSIAFTLAAGMAAIGASCVNPAAPVKADAEEITLYCKMSQSWWKADGAAVGAYYWGGSEGVEWPGTRMSVEDASNDIWSVNVPSDAVNIIFTRVNGSGTIADWGTKTKDLVIPTDGKNLFTITSSTPVWSEPWCDGEWSTYVPDSYTVSIDKEEQVALTKDETKNEYYLKDVYNVAHPASKIEFFKNGVEYTPTVKASTVLNRNNIEENDGSYKLVKGVDTYSIYLDPAEGVWVTGYTGTVKGYFGVGGWENVYAYTHGGYAEGEAEYALGAWPGTKLTPVNGVRFETHESVGYGLYPFEIAIGEDGKLNQQIIFNNGEEGGAKIETASLAIIDDAYYGAHYETTGDTKRGAAAAFITEIVGIINAGDYMHGELAHSICALSTGEAQWVVGKYSALDEEAKGYVDAASYYTYVDATSDAKQDWSFADIFTEITARAGGAGSGTKLFATINNDSTFLISVITISTLAIAGLVILYIRKRKSVQR